MHWYRKEILSEWLVQLNTRLQNQKQIALTTVIKFFQTYCLAIVQRRRNFEVTILGFIWRVSTSQWC